MQDYYSDWPYQDVGIPSYLTTVDTIVSAVASGPYASHYVFVPFNEPNDIWYDLNPADSDFSTQMAQFESDWATVYRPDPGRRPGRADRRAEHVLLRPHRAGRLPGLRQGQQRAAQTSSPGTS